MADTTLGARFTNPRISRDFGDDSMPQTADNIAKDLNISREESDRFAAASQAKYEAARAEGFFAGEIIPTEVPQGRKQPPRIVDADEHPRPASTLEVLGGLRPLFEDGVVTAGNASGINEGAAALGIRNAANGEQ